MVTGQFTQHMSDEDALMWHIEKDPILRSTIVAVAIFDRPPDLDALRGAHRSRDLRDPAACASACCRRRSASARPAGRSSPRSTSTSTCAACASPRRATRPHAARRAATDRVRARSTGPGRCGSSRSSKGSTTADRAAFAMKVHHSVTDGVGGMALLAELVDLEREPGEPTTEPTCPRCPRPRRSARSRSCATRSSHTTPADARHRAPHSGPRHVERVRRGARSGRRGRRTSRSPRARSAACSRRRRRRCRRVMRRSRARSLPRRCSNVGLDDLKPYGEGDRGQRQRRVPRRGRRWSAPLPRAPRRRASIRCA